MEDKYGSQGLTVVGVTSEGESQTEPWVESKGARYAYAYDRGGKLKNALGVTGIPNAVLVDPSGTILWQGHPSSLTNELVEQAIKGSIETPIYEWGGSAKGIKKAFLKGDFAKALKEADKLAEEEELGTEIGTMLRKMVADRVASFEADLERGDVLKAYDGAKAISSGIKGLPEEERISAMLKKISKDKDLKSALKAQTKLNEIMALELRRKKDCDESIKQLEKLMKGFEGTRTGDLIGEGLKSVQITKGKMKR
ncbi:MAG: hypothetical protein ACJAZ8_002822 [Planctomycetota bacterium]